MSNLSYDHTNLVDKKFQNLLVKILMLNKIFGPNKVLVKKIFGKIYCPKQYFGRKEFWSIGFSVEPRGI